MPRDADIDMTCWSCLKLLQVRVGTLCCRLNVIASGVRDVELLMDWLCFVIENIVHNSGAVCVSRTATHGIDRWKSRSNPVPQSSKYEQEVRNIYMIWYAR
jgi:hypothetical protein